MNLSNAIFPSRGLALVWVLLLLGLVAWLGVRMNDAPILDANLMSLLPAVASDSAVQGATDKFRERFERRVVLLIGASDSTQAIAATKTVLTKLRASASFTQLSAQDGSALIQQAGAFYFPLRFGLLSTAARRQLTAGDVKEFERAVLVRYFSPVSGLQSGLIEHDPLHLLSNFLEERAASSPARFETQDGFLLTRGDGQVFVLLSGVLNDSPFSFELQNRLGPIMESLDAKTPGISSDITILKAGVFFHAHAGTSNAKSEISTVGLGALAGIVLLFIAVFRSWRPLSLSLFSISAGCLGGLVICVAMFGQVHLLTLVFGASLIGISVDYSLHYFCEHLRQKEHWSPRAAIGHVFPGVTLGLVTSVIGFAGLLFASFPGMQQVAIFSGSGLIFSYICVLTIYPLFKKALKTDHMARPLVWSAAHTRVSRRLWGPRAWLILAALLVVGAVGISQLQPQDDIRQLQSADETVLAEEDRVRNMIGDDLASQFFLVQGKDEAELLMREERLIQTLKEYQEQAHISGYVAISEFVPSPAKMAENRNLLAPLIVGEGSLLRRVAERVGLARSAVERYVDDFNNAQPADSKHLSDWLESPLGKSYQNLWLGSYGEGVSAVVGLKGVRRPAELIQLTDPGNGITFVDSVGRLSETFGDIRRQAGWLILVSYAFVSLILFVRYGLRGGLAVMLAPTIAAITSLGIQGLIGEPLSLFNVLAVLLVLGIGVDYGIFYRETGAASRSTLVAIALSSITTLLAFGLLALSSTTAVHAFGLTILIGIGIAFLLAPLAGVGKQMQEA